MFLDHSEVKLNERHNGRAIIRKTFKGLKNQNPAQKNLNYENGEHYGYFFSNGPDRYVYNRVSFNMNVSDVHSAKSLKASLDKLEKKQQTYKYDRFEADHLVQNDLWSIIYSGKLPRNGQGDSSKSLLCSSSTNSAFNRTQIGFSDALKKIFLKQAVEGEPYLTIFHSENQFSLAEIIHKICYDTIISRGNMIEVFIRDRSHQAWLELFKDNKHKYLTEAAQIQNLKKPFLLKMDGIFQNEEKLRDAALRKEFLRVSHDKLLPDSHRQTTTFCSINNLTSENSILGLLILRAQQFGYHNTHVKFCHSIQPEMGQLINKSQISPVKVINGCFTKQNSIRGVINKVDYFLEKTNYYPSNQGVHEIIKKAKQDLFEQHKVMSGKALCVVDEFKQYVADGQELVFVNKKNQELSSELKAEAGVGTSNAYVLTLESQVMSQKTKWNNPDATLDLQFEIDVNNALITTNPNQKEELFNKCREALQKQLINLDNSVKFPGRVYLSPFSLSTTSPSYTETQQNVRARFTDTPILGRPELTPSWLGLESLSSLISSSSTNSTDSNNSGYL